MTPSLIEWLFRWPSPRPVSAFDGLESNLAATPSGAGRFTRRHRPGFSTRPRVVRRTRRQWSGPAMCMASTVLPYCDANRGRCLHQSLALLALGLGEAQSLAARPPQTSGALKKNERPRRRPAKWRATFGPRQSRGLPAPAIGGRPSAALPARPRKLQLRRKPPQYPPRKTPASGFRCSRAGARSAARSDRQMRCVRSSGRGRLCLNRTL